GAHALPRCPPRGSLPCFAPASLRLRAVLIWPGGRHPTGVLWRPHDTPSDGDPKLGVGHRWPPCCHGRNLFWPEIGLHGHAVSDRPPFAPSRSCSRTSS